MKKGFMAVVVVLLMFSLCACCVNHEFVPATCLTAATCSKCGEVTGAPLGHTWLDANCIQPKTCSVCSASEGEVAEHTWKEATCIEPKTCSVCGATEGQTRAHEWQEASCSIPKKCVFCGLTDGETLEHQWVDATCSQAKHCSVCNLTEGKPLAHTIHSWTTEFEPTCNKFGIEKGICVVCSGTDKRSVDKLPHTTGSWVISKMPSGTTSGEKILKCMICDEIIETENFTLTKGEQNALKTAKQYLNVMGFSYSGLIEQLEYEGYSTAEATTAADLCGANWYDQAAIVAENYLSVMGFSRSGLIDQLIYEGFTRDQAEYGVEQNGY